MHRFRWLCIACLAIVVISAGCEKPPAPRSSAKPSRLAQSSGTLAVAGLRDEVQIVRDRWGIPHIYARNADDLFMAQGLVQAQDRLFQIDLWRRSTEGRLAEILGSNFIARDRLTRLVRYRGNEAEEWASYAPDTRQIATAFVRGINAWIEITRDNLPEEFEVAGYAPEPWKPENLLSRAEAFAMSSNALLEVFRSRLTVAVGLERATLLLPPDPAVAIRASRDVDLGVVNAILADGLANIGASARFDRRIAVSGAPLNELAGPVLGLSAERTINEGSNNWVVSGERSTTGKPILANDPHRNLDHPSLRYLVHLNAPGWNVIGSVVPWFPGVAIGHNDRIAWGLTIFANDAQDLYIERVNPANPRQYHSKGRWIDMDVVKDTIRTRDSDKPVEVEHLYTVHGPVVAVDRERQLAFALRWTGSEPGTAGYLAGLSLDRATNWNEFRTALGRWKMPGENFVYADVDGNIGYQAAALAPNRGNWLGLYPVAGWTGEFEWDGWHNLDDLPHAFNPRAGYLATANHNTLSPGYRHNVNFFWGSPARINRIHEVFEGNRKFGVEDFKNLQHDTVAWTATKLVPLLERLSPRDPDVARARQMLLDWDRSVSEDSPAASIFVVWEGHLVRELVSGKLDRHLTAEYLRRQDGGVLVPAIVRAAPAWFGSNAVSKRDALLERTLGLATAELRKELGEDMTAWRWGRLHSATFKHPLSARDARLEKRFNVGPISRAGYGDTVFLTGGSGFTQTDGATFREIMDVGDWDRSVGTSAPGQSGQPGSPHFDDLAKLWANHEYFPYSFSRAMVDRSAEATLILTPKR